MKKIIAGITLLLVFSAPLHAVKQKILASDGEAFDWFGSDVAVDDHYAVIGASRDQSNSSDPIGAAYFFQWDGSNWVEQARVEASDGANNDQFGDAVAIDGDYAIVGATRIGSFDGGAGYIFKREGANWTQQEILKGGDYTSLFGEDVDISGQYAIIGARTETNGTARIFKRSGESWALDDLLTASDGVLDDWFGYSVAIDGDYAIIGAAGRSNFVGGAYIFMRDGDDWNEQAIINNPDPSTNWLTGAGNSFGQTVDISGDYAVVGNDDDRHGAYVFKRTGTNWNLQAELGDVFPRTGVGTGFYGDRVAIDDPYALVGGDQHAILWKRSGSNWIKQIYIGHSDWNIVETSLDVHDGKVFAGCYGDDDTAENAGAAYALAIDDRNRQSELNPTNAVGVDTFGSGVAVAGDFALVGAPSGISYDSHGYCGAFLFDGRYWFPHSELVPDDATAYQDFGESVELYGDYAIVGAPGDEEAFEDAGAAYIFERDDTNWIQRAKMMETTVTTDDWLGTAVDMDDNYALAGAPGFGSDGHVLIYKRATTNWTELARLYGNPSASAFGASIDYDGNLAIVGSPDETVGGGLTAGAAYIYSRAGDNWTMMDRITASDPANGTEFGASVAVYGNYAAVGAPNYDGSEYQSGAVYVFEYSGGSWSQMDQLLPPMAESNGYFGSSVAMNETNIMVGASGSRNGAVYRREGTDWNLMANIEPGDGEEEEAFGSCVDLSEDYGVAGALSTHARKAYLFYPVDYNFILWNQKDFVYLRNGWKWFDWFGYVNDEIYPWVKHFEHGWMYSVSSSSDSIWFYTWDMGWLWTSTTLYPYIYRSSDDAWLWYQRDTVNPRWFANLRTSLWETH